MSMDWEEDEEDFGLFDGLPWVDRVEKEGPNHESEHRLRNGKAGCVRDIIRRLLAKAERAQSENTQKFAGYQQANELVEHTHDVIDQLSNEFDAASDELAEYQRLPHNLITLAAPQSVLTYSLVSSEAMAEFSGKQLRRPINEDKVISWLQDNTFLDILKDNIMVEAREAVIKSKERYRGGEL